VVLSTLAWMMHRESCVVCLCGDLRSPIEHQGNSVSGSKIYSHGICLCSCCDGLFCYCPCCWFCRRCSPYRCRCRCSCPCCFLRVFLKTSRSDSIYLIPSHHAQTDCSRHSLRLVTRSSFQATGSARRAKARPCIWPGGGPHAAGAGLDLNMHPMPLPRQCCKLKKSFSIFVNYFHIIFIRGFGKCPRLGRNCALS